MTAWLRRQGYDVSRPIGPQLRGPSEHNDAANFAYFRTWSGPSASRSDQLLFERASVGRRHHKAGSMGDNGAPDGAFGGVTARPSRLRRTHALQRRQSQYMLVYFAETLVLEANAASLRSVGHL